MQRRWWIAIACLTAGIFPLTTLEAEEQQVPAPLAPEPQLEQVVVTITSGMGPHAQLRLTVDNLFDTKPQFDPSWTSWPFYTRNWFSPVGREFYLSFNYQLPALRR